MYLIITIIILTLTIFILVNKKRIVEKIGTNLLGILFLIAMGSGFYLLSISNLKEYIITAIIFELAAFSFSAFTIIYEKAKKLEKLREYNDMLNKSTITKEKFEQEKNKILQ